MPAIPLAPDLTMCDARHMSEHPAGNSRLVGTTEAAEILGVNKATVLRWGDAGKLTVVHRLPGDNGAVLFSRAEVMSLLTEQLARSAATA